LLVLLAAAVPAVAQAAGTTSPISTWNVKTIPIPTKDAVFDPTRNTMLVTVRSKHPSLGNMLVEVNLSTGDLGRRVYVGSSPNKLALTDDGAYVYVALEGANRIARVALSTFTLDQSFSVGNAPLIYLGGPMFAEDIETVPGRNDTVVATLGIPRFSAFGGVWVFRNGVALPNHTVDGTSANDIEVTSPSTALGFDRGFSAHRVRAFSIDQNGITNLGFKPIVTGDTYHLYQDAEYAGGRLFFTTGLTVDPVTLSSVQSFPKSGLIEIAPIDHRITFFENRRITIFDTLSGGQLETRSFPELPRWANALVCSGNGFVVTSRDELHLLGPLVLGGEVGIPAGKTSEVAGMKSIALPIPTDDVVYDKHRNRVYASVAKDVPERTNQLLALDADTGAEVGRLTFSMQPGALAITDDGSRLFVNLSSTGTCLISGEIGSVDLERFQVIESHPLGMYVDNPHDGSEAGMVATDIETVPGTNDQVAASLKAACTYPGHLGVAIYKKGQQLPEMVSPPPQAGGPRTIEFGDASTLFGLEYNTSGAFYQLSVDAAGVRSVDKTTRVLDNGDIDLVGGKVYSSAGLVVEAETGQRIGHLDANREPQGLPAVTAVEAVPSMGRIFLVNWMSPDLGEPGWQVEEYDIEQFRLLGVLKIPATDGGSLSDFYKDLPEPMVSTGDGLAIGGHNLLIIGPAASEVPPEPPVIPTALAWGFNGYGQLGLPGQNVPGIVPSPAEVGLQDVVQVSAGFYSSTALLKDGTVWAWGWNGLGSVGDGSTTDRKTPVRVSGLTNVISIDSGYFHNLAVKADGTVWSWGYNALGQLGDGTVSQRSKPVQVRDLTGVKSVSAGAYHSLALKNDGTVWSWGWNALNQLGLGSTDPRHIATQVPKLTQVAGVSAGDHHNLASTTSGAVWAWGWNGLGQLGDGTVTDRALPKLLPSLTAVTSVAAGYAHSLALDQNGVAFSWGWNLYGQLGDGTSNAGRRTPVRLPEATPKLDSISAGFLHNVAVGGGRMYSWGWDAVGQLGDGPAISNRLTPVDIPNGPSGLTSVSAGVLHSMAVRGP
jgi:alpha-tubulin suppressor-like RCC1 family protein/sugar lactone lactonase YvrE